jgi:SPP1 family phage portal protein
MTIEEIELIWGSRSIAQSDRQNYRNYYDGRQKILNEAGVYVDGKKKSRIVTNFIADGIDGYVGALTSTRWQLTSQEGSANAPGPEEYKRLSDLLYIESVDAEVLRGALISGFGVEIHSFDKEISITPGNPLEWESVYDSASGELLGAIRRYELLEGAVLNGVVLDKPKQFTVWYDTAEITTWGQEEGQWKLVSSVPHRYGCVPVVFWTVNEDKTGIISDALISQQDEYNSIDSATGDEIRAFVDSILAITGVDPDWLQKNSSQIRETRLLPIGSDDSSVAGSAFYLTRSQDVTPSQTRLDRTKQNIHMMGKTPDMVEITGVTGDTSGIALKLRFMPMINQAMGFVPFLKRAFRARIDLINVINAKRGKPVIEDYVLTIQFTLPTNNIEQWANIGTLTGIVSHRKQLELLSDVDDPERELAAVKKEGPRTVTPVGGTGAAANNTADLQETSKNTEIPE